MTRDGFVITSHIGLVFFRWCCIYKIPPHDKRRVQAFQRLVAKKKAKYLPHIK
jgi:hypothetical protein